MSKLCQIMLHVDKQLAQADKRRFAFADVTSEVTIIADLFRSASTDICRVALSENLQCSRSHETCGAVPRFCVGVVKFGYIFLRRGWSYRRSDHEDEIPSSCRLRPREFAVRRDQALVFNEHRPINRGPWGAPGGDCGAHLLVASAPRCLHRTRLQCSISAIGHRATVLGRATLTFAKANLLRRRHQWR